MHPRPKRTTPLLIVLAIALMLSPTFAGDDVADIVEILIRNFPEGTKDIPSNTQAVVDEVAYGAFEFVADIEDIDPLENLLNVLEDVDEKFSDDDEPNTGLGDALAGFGVFLLDDGTGTADERAEVLTAKLQTIYDADPAIGFDGTFTNRSAAPLDINVGFAQGTVPVPIDTPLMYETFLTAEVTDSSGDGAASAASVFVTYTRTLSDVTGPTELNTVTGQAELDGTLNVVSGAPFVESSGPNNLFVSNLDVDFFNGLGVPPEDRGTIAINASLQVADLSPGDTITVRYGYSLGTEDGAIQLYPTEELVLALEQELFVPIARSGDYNRDGEVNAPDYNVWRDSFGSTTNLDADGNDNGVVDAADYNIWRDNFGNSAGASVPEPSSLLLVSFLASVFWRRRRVVFPLA